VGVSEELRRFDCTDDDVLEEGIEAAVAELGIKRLVVLPTDTVYGVAADAFQGAAVRRLLRAKGRGRDMPPPVLIAKADALESLAAGVPAYAREMVEALWPGPLTLICTQQPSLSWDIGDNRGTVAVRVPAHPVALALLERTGPLAVSSANRTGMPAAQTVIEAEEMLGDRVRIFLDDGPRSTAVASTIVDVTGPRPRVLRSGGVTLAQLREYDERTVVSTSGMDDDDSDGGSDDGYAGRSEVFDEPVDEPVDEPAEEQLGEPVDEPVDGGSDLSAEVLPGPPDDTTPMTGPDEPTQESPGQPADGGRRDET